MIKTGRALIKVNRSPAGQEGQCDSFDGTCYLDTDKRYLLVQRESSPSKNAVRWGDSASVRCNDVSLVFQDEELKIEAWWKYEFPTDAIPIRKRFVR